MAFLVPDNLGSRKDVADSIRRVAKAFQTGIDDVGTVWYEPLFDTSGELPHLVVLEPSVGVVVLEVLKGKQGSVLGAFRGRLRLEIDGEEIEVDSPLERAERFAGLLRERIAGRPHLADVRVGAVAVLSGMTRDEANAKKVDSLLDLDVTIFKPDLDAAIDDGNGAAILRVLRKATAGGERRELADLELTELRGVIHPDVVITPVPEQGALFTALADDDIVNVMDRRQEATAKGLGAGHRIIRGVAGSGKTLVLVHRARLLSKVMPNDRILFTCYTKSLASQLRHQLAECENVHVQHLDGVMAGAISKAGLKHPGYKGDRSGRDVAVVALEAVAKGGAKSYRAVLVDEAQDFDTEALQFCTKLLAEPDPEKQDLVIVADSAQNIFRKNFRWKDAGIRAQGRSRILKVNYRNTRQILEFAHAFLIADVAISVDDVPDDEDEMTIIPAESSERDGPEPTVLIEADADGEIRAVVDAVKQQLTNRSTARSIAVLYGEPSAGEKTRGDDLHAALEAAGVAHFYVTDSKAKGNKDQAGSTDESVVLSTIHSAKGLEYPHVIVCGLGARDDLVTARKLAYVGMTRATQNLTVITHRAAPFAESLQLASHG